MIIMIEFNDDSLDGDEDIFTPGSNSLNDLFKEQKRPPVEIPSHEAPAPKRIGANTSSVVIVDAFTWDGAAYQPVGKLGLTLVLKEDKAFMVLFKSKQQTLSMVDITLDQLKIEQHSDILLGTLDSQARSISLYSLCQIGFLESTLHLCY